MRDADLQCNEGRAAARVLMRMRSVSDKTEVRTCSPGEPLTWASRERQLVVRLGIVVDTDADISFLLEVS